jgi:hypothetical protein
VFVLVLNGHMDWRPTATCGVLQKTLILEKSLEPVIDLGQTADVFFAVQETS